MRRGFSIYGCALLLLSVLAPGADAEQLASFAYRTETNVVYREGAELTPEMKERCRLDLYVPLGRKDFATVVWFHGGGLTGGKRAVPKALQEQGIAVVAAGYRLSPSVKAPAYIEDAAAAVAWTFRHIAERGGATNRIFVSGHSAGGYLTSMVGLDKKWLAAFGIDANAIAGLVPFSGQCITHFTVRAERGIADKQPVIDEFAPLFHARKDAPPLLLITGDRERELLGRYEENAYLWRMMKEVGHADTKINELQGFNHAGMAEPAFPLLLQFIRQHDRRRSTDEAGLLEIERKVSHGYATNNGVRIHYARLGQGPLVVMIHGFPDYWLTWREQMETLAADHEVVAIDQRGYNLSDRPKGVENYDMQLLAADIAAVIKARGRDRAIVVGHDWGGAVAWTFAMTRPEMTEKLIVLNLPHPRGLARELATNPEQQKNSAYARQFQQEGAHTNLTAEGLTFWVKDNAARARYLEAFRRSDFEAMLNYYKRNYPREPYREDTAAPVVKVQCPVLMIHGLKDKALGEAALNGNWNYVTKDLTLVTAPEADHWVQQDAADLVTRTIVSWLHR